jgi:hypothetical protein
LRTNECGSKWPCEPLAGKERSAGEIEPDDLERFGTTKVAGLQNAPVGSASAPLNLPARSRIAFRPMPLGIVNV